jgi:DNA methylase
MNLYYQDDWVSLYHGDCLEHTEWLTADVLVTDPPYGVPGGRVGKHPAGGHQTHADAHWDSITTRDAALTLWGLKPRAVFGSPTTQSPGHRGTPVIWDKGDDPGMGDHTWPFGPSYELIWINGEGWNGKRRNSILRSPRLTTDARNNGHPTPKPVPLMETIISYAPAGVIADPFAGSGSTLVAAKALRRKAIGVELEERYCEIAANRLSQDTLDFTDVSATVIA